jgi:hypothetical protein
LSLSLVACGASQDGEVNRCGLTIREVDTRSLSVQSDVPDQEVNREIKSGFLTIRVGTKLGNGAEKLLSPLEQLKSGDRFHIWLESSEPAYASVTYISISPEGDVHPATLLKCLNGTTEVKLQPGSAVRFPPEGSSIVLDKIPALEHIYVIAARRPLGGLGDDTSEAIASIGDHQQFKVNPPPPRAEPRPADKTAPGPGAGAGNRPVKAQNAPVKAQKARVGTSPRTAPPADDDFSTDTVVRSIEPVIRTRGLKVEADDHSIHASPDELGVTVVFFPIDHVSR